MSEPAVPAVPAVISLVTLGVADLDRATAFYQALGWKLSSSSVPGDVSFFRTAGPILALWPHHLLAADSGREVGRLPDGYRGTALAINVADEAAVDAVLAAAERAGGTILKPAQKAEWGGYTGYFADTEGHAVEVAHNPGWPLGPDGLPILPD
jgi:catechol 2,3-dioxygenase-like lactoylglutathione lyase family enzyme